MVHTVISDPANLKRGARQIRNEISELGELLAVRRLEKACRDIKYQLAAVRFETALIRDAVVSRKAGFNPNEPRVPAGSPEGGQWTTEGGTNNKPRVGTGPKSRSGGGNPTRVRLADASNASGSPVMSDATPDPIIPGAQYAQTRINVHTSALTGISSIDDTTMRLAHTLARVKDVIDYAPDLGPAVYGTAVHTGFAAALRLQQIPGVEVEPTFGGAFYGAKDSVRPDAVLRNDVGDIVAIYDVKTGEKSIDPTRAAKLRLNLGVGNDVPIIEMSIPYGVRRKAALQRNLVACSDFNSIFGRREVS